MSKIDTNKTNDFREIREARRTDAQPISKRGTARAENKIEIGALYKLEVSNRGAAFGELVRGVKLLPDVRAELVSALCEKIAAGGYHPASFDIAGAITKDEFRGY